MNTSPTVLLFLKAPRPGFVKTRLAKTLGNEKACEIYRHLGSSTLKKIPTGWNVRIYFAPSEALEEMTSWLGESASYHPQTDGDLGDRLTAACQESFQEGASSLILLGGDCFSMTSDHLQTAAKNLMKNQPVIGPALDGGYWLLGLPATSPEVFRNILWSSNTVYTETIKRFTSLDQKPYQLETLDDIDDASSWSRALISYPDLQKLN